MSLYSADSNCQNSYR